MKFSKLFFAVVFFPYSVFASVPQTAKVCVFEAAQSKSWSVSCDGKQVDGGTIAGNQTNEMAISLQLSSLIDLGFNIKACTSFPNSYGIRCILTK
jgi:hypothetical protein